MTAASNTTSPTPEEETPAGIVVSVNISRARTVQHQGRDVETGIFKTPTLETQRVAGVNIGDDEQADLNAHGGEHKAVYAYAIEDYEWWNTETGNDFTPGTFGENLTTRGIDVTGARIGDRWHIGTTTFEVSEPRVPCFKLTLATGIPRFQQTFGNAGRPGSYLRIIEEGELTVSDAIHVETAEQDITIGHIATIYHHDNAAAHRLIDLPGLSEPWRRWAAAQNGSD